MLYYSLFFLVIALLAGILGFGVVAFAAAEIARNFSVDLRGLFCSGRVQRR